MELLNNKFEFNIKTNIRFGAGLTKDLPKIINEFSFKQLGFIVDGNLYDCLPWLQEVILNCKKNFDNVIVHLYREDFEPTYQFLDKVKLKFKKDKEPLVDCIVGIGGGSTIDSAKGIATLVTNHKNAIEYRGFPTNLNPSLPIIAIPSTAGTGTEVTYNAVFINQDTNKKLGINTKNNYPILSIIDPEIVATAPKSVAISAGIDALVHTLESFVSKKSTYLTRIFAKEAFKLIVNTLPKLVENLNDLELWSKMQLGASLAMISLSNSSSGPAGGFSYLLGSNYKVPHGIAGGVFIGKISRINHELGYYDYAQLYNMLDNVNPNITEKKERSNIVVSTVESLLKKLDIPDTLSPYGISSRDFNIFYDFATDALKGSFALNPMEISNEKKKKLLTNMIGG